jgi:hypothetical protein
MRKEKKVRKRRITGRRKQTDSMPLFVKARLMKTTCLNIKQNKN